MKTTSGLISREVDWSEFLQMTMLRLGKISKSELDKIRQRFNELDVNKDGNGLVAYPYSTTMQGRFSRLEMNLALAFDKWDKDGSGELDIDEWVGLCTQLNRKYHCFGDVSDMEAAFREIDVVRPTPTFVLLFYSPCSEGWWR